MRAPTGLRGRVGVAVIAALAVAPVLVGSGASLGRPAAAQTAEGGLVITEVVANGGGGARDAALEWVEIQNRGQSAVELEGWGIQDNHSHDPLGAGRCRPGTSLFLWGARRRGRRRCRPQPCTSWWRTGGSATGWRTAATGWC